MTSSMWTLNDIQTATGARTTMGELEASGFSIDSRTIEPGQVYIALLGERVDGHDYVADALEKGAAAALVHHVAEGVAESAQLVVEDTFEALRDLAAYHRNRLTGKIIGITGSVGKTGTKEALRLALGSKGKTYASHGNFNNHIGAPLCLVNMPLDAKFGVFEMGMNHVGEISQLSLLIRPHLAIITTVEAVHIEFFDSEEAIADAKAEIFDGMDEDGIATLNADNPHFLRLKRAAEKHGLGRVISFGVNEMAMCRLMEYKADVDGSDVVATINGTPVHYRLGTIGRHWALTSVAVLASAEALGCDLPKAAEALAQFREPKGRGRLVGLPWGGGTLMLVDDSYNASPLSMASAIENF
ncbi:MAG: UDP-N-acetylmuramoyl-tripeptide--D-alanyl-D-alanine ligase, partial [Rickettsiales bacterium]